MNASWAAMGVTAMTTIALSQSDRGSVGILPAAGSSSRRTPKAALSCASPRCILTLKLAIDKPDADIEEAASVVELLRKVDGLALGDEA